jgi:hypothetical protein
MAFWDLSDSQRMGAGLIGFAFFFILLGFALFFDRALLALGNIFLIVGVILLLVGDIALQSCSSSTLLHSIGTRSGTNVLRTAQSSDRLGLFLRGHCLTSSSLAHCRRNLGNRRIL